MSVRNRIGIAAALAVLVASALALAAQAFVRTSTSGWNWGSPQPQGETLNAIGAGGAGTYAVGDFGTLLRSDDGGHTWSGIRTATRTDLRRLSVVDADAFVAGGGCTLIRSEDGGRTLRQRRLPCGSRIAALDFPTRATGYAVRGDGRVLQLAASLGSVERTRLPSSAGRPHDIECTNAVTCVAAAQNAILRTTDGGNTWKQVHPAGANGLFVAGPQIGYAVGPNRVLKTTDGGATWTPRETPNRTLVEVSCGDALHCVVVARSHVVLHTADGFDTLETSKQNNDPTVPVFENTVAFTSANHVVAAGKGGYTWTSEDGGLGFDRGYISPFFTAGIAAGSGRTAFAFGRKGFVARTTDGGRTWQRRTRAPAGDWAGWFVPDLDSDTSGMAAIDRKGRLFRSSDGAGSWTALGKASPRGPRALWSSPDGKTMLVGGPFGLLRSTNGGGKFTKVLEGPVLAIEHAGDFVFLVGPRSILRTDDGGASFTELGNPPGRIVDVAFPTASLAFATTGEGRLWRTSDGIGRWREVLSLASGAALGAGVGGFRANEDGSIEGSVAVHDFGGSGKGLGWVLHTSDGGRTWRPQLVGDEPVRDLELGKGRGRMVARLGSNYLFWTVTGGDAGKASALSIRRTPEKVVGRLTGPGGKQKVVVSWRRPKGTAWHAVRVLTTKKGAYRWTPPGDGRYVVVAQWLGNLRYRGAGSKHVVWRPPEAPALPAGRPVLRHGVRTTNSSAQFGTWLGSSSAAPARRAGAVGAARAARARPEPVSASGCRLRGSYPR